MAKNFKSMNDKILCLYIVIVYPILCRKNNDKKQRGKKTKKQQKARSNGDKNGNSNDIQFCFKKFVFSILTGLYA